MTIAEDFDEILEAGGGDLKVQWPKLVRALKSLRDWGVNMDAGAIDAPATAAPTNSLFVRSDGNVGFGADPTAANKVLIDEGTGAIDVRIRTGDANATSLLLENSVATWRMFTAGSGVWALQDAVAGTQPITVQEGADSNALFIDDAGHIGLGLDPTATFDFISALGDTNVWRFQAGDATANFQINAGATTGHNADIALLGQFSTRWILRKNTAQQFEIRSTAGATVLLEAAAPTNSIYVDADGHVGFGGDPNTFAFRVEGTGSVWRFHNVADAQAFLDIGGGSTAEQAVDLRWVDRLGARQWALRKEAGNRLALIDNAGNGPFIVEQGAALNALYIDSTDHVGIGIANPGTRFYVANADDLGNTAGNETEVAVFQDTFTTGSNSGRFRINMIRRAGTINTWGGSGYRLEANIDDNASAQNWIELIHPDDTDLTDHYIAFGEAASTEWARFHNGKLGVGVGAEPNAAAIIQADSTTQGLLPPRMTTTQRNNISSPPDGLLIYNSTTNELNLRANSAWGAFITLSANTTEEAADRTPGTTETAFVTMANISFPGPTDGSTDYLVIATISVDPTTSPNLEIGVRMGQNGTTADALQQLFIEFINATGAAERTFTCHTVVTPAANDVLTLTYRSSAATAWPIKGSAGDGRTSRVTIYQMPA